MWPYLLNIFQNGISHLEGQRKLLNALTLESPNSNLLVDPVDIVQGEPADFSNSQTIDSQKQDDRACPDMAFLLCIEIGN